MVAVGSYLLLSLTILATVPVMMFVLEVFAAIFFARRSPSQSGLPWGPSGVVILIPAHNESGGIASTLNNIIPQLPTGARILVVADNCTDDTRAIAASTGVDVVERKDPRLRGKGYALDFGIRHLTANPPGILIVVDADCRFSQGSIATLSSICQAASRPVQALNLMTAPDDQPEAFQFAEFAWRIKNWIRPLGLSALHLPCQLTGTGMAFPWEVIQSASLASGEIVEDLKLGLELALKGNPPLFCPAACVVSHFPSTQKGSDSQRQRWERGHLNMILRDTPRLFWNSLASGNFRAMFLTLDLAVPPLFLLVMIEFAIFLSSGLAIWIGMSPLSLYVAATALVAFAISVLLCWTAFGRDVLPGTKLLTFPMLLVKKLTFYRRLLAGSSAPPQWVRADRSKSDSPEN